MRTTPGSLAAPAAGATSPNGRDAQQIGTGEARLKGRRTAGELGYQFRIGRARLPAEAFRDLRQLVRELQRYQQGPLVVAYTDGLGNLTRLGHIRFRCMANDRAMGRVLS